MLNRSLKNLSFYLSLELESSTQIFDSMNRLSISSQFFDITSNIFIDIAQDIQDIAQLPVNSHATYQAKAHTHIDTRNTQTLKLHVWLHWYRFISHPPTQPLTIHVHSPDIIFDTGSITLFGTSS